MNIKIELRNFIEHYGLSETEEALEELKRDKEEGKLEPQE